ncbi:cytochrome [Streptomyces albus subsp. albus]|nr:cytochrome [Streptomyces albus subsp. albus]
MPRPEPIPLYGRAYKRDPYPLYERMRAAGPIHRVRFPSGVDAWLVTGYQAAVRTLADPRLGKNHDLGNGRWRERASIMPEPQHSQLQVHLLHQDPPRHTLMRRMVSEAFAPRRMEELRPRFQRIADRLVDEMPPTGGADLVRCFAARFPFLVLAEVIGLPPRLAAGFRREWGKVVQPVGPLDPRRARYEALLHGLQGYIAEVVAAKAAEPADDLLGRLTAACAAGELTREERDSVVFQLLVAGQEPVTNQITTALLTLFKHPEALDRLRTEPEVLPRAVEELLRYDGAFELTTWRFLAEDDELHGTRVPAGDSVIVSLCAANRDPEHFDRPDELDLDRAANPHLSFGHGIHYCPGAMLARIELQIAIGTLTARLPGLSLAVPAEEIEWIPAVLARGTDHLPVHYTRTAQAGD